MELGSPSVQKVVHSEEVDNPDASFREKESRRAELIVEGLLLESNPRILKAYAESLRGLRGLEQQIYKLGAAILKIENNNITDICLNAVTTNPNLCKKLLPSFCTIALDLSSEVGLKAALLSSAIRRGAPLSDDIYINPWNKTSILSDYFNYHKSWIDQIKSHDFSTTHQYSKALVALETKLSCYSDEAGVIREIARINSMNSISEYHAHYLSIATLYPRSEVIREAALEATYDRVRGGDVNYLYILLSTVPALVQDISSTSSKEQRLALMILDAAGHPSTQLAPFIAASFSAECILTDISISGLELSARVLPTSATVIIADRLGEFLLDDSIYDLSTHVASLRAHERLLAVVDDKIGDRLVDNIREVFFREEDYPIDFLHSALTSLRAARSSVSSAIDCISEVVLSNSYSEVLRMRACYVLGEISYEGVDSKSCQIVDNALNYHCSSPRPNPLIKEAANIAHSKLKSTYPEKFVGMIRL